MVRASAADVRAVAPVAMRVHGTRRGAGRARSCKTLGRRINGSGRQAHKSIRRRSAGAPRVRPWMAAASTARQGARRRHQCLSSAATCFCVAGGRSSTGQGTRAHLMCRPESPTAGRAVPGPQRAAAGSRRRRGVIFPCGAHRPTRPIFFFSQAVHAHVVLGDGPGWPGLCPAALGWPAAGGMRYWLGLRGGTSYCPGDDAGKPPNGPEAAAAACPPAA